MVGLTLAYGWVMVEQISPPRATPNTVNSDPGPLNPTNSESKWASGRWITNQCPRGTDVVKF
eukprot:10941665-Heterocapsa_arctica.AAC.1